MVQYTFALWELSLMKKSFDKVHIYHFAMSGGDWGALPLQIFPEPLQNI